MKHCFLLFFSGSKIMFMMSAGLLSDRSDVCVCSLLGMQRSMQRSSSSAVVTSAVIYCQISCDDDSARTQTYSTVARAVTWLAVYRALQVMYTHKRNLHLKEHTVKINMIFT